MKHGIKWLMWAFALTLIIQGCSSEKNKMEQNETGSSTINGKDYVDLGLSVKWATYNVGASSPSDYGRYFSWGEIAEPVDSDYSSANCYWYGKSVTEDEIKGNPLYDAARANWGGTWRMPTTDEIDELVNECQWEWTISDDHNGYKVTGPNGNSIFLPAAGFHLGKLLLEVGEIGAFWSSTPCDSDAAAYCLGFIHSENFLVNSFDSYDFGQSIRPVTE